VIRKISFYCYFFLDTFDEIDRYDILFRHGDRCIVKHSELDREYKNPTGNITAGIFTGLESAIHDVVCRLRNLEVQHGVYTGLSACDQLNEHYRSFISSVAEAATKQNINSFSIFGDPRKYRPQTGAREFLRRMGYHDLKSVAPRIYVLNDIVKRELG
jgi:hypothetical protein